MENLGPVHFGLKMPKLLAYVKNAHVSQRKERCWRVRGSSQRREALRLGDWEKWREAHESNAATRLGIPRHRRPIGQVPPLIMAGTGGYRSTQLSRLNVCVFPNKHPKKKYAGAAERVLKNPALFSRCYFLLRPVAETSARKNLAIGLWIWIRCLVFC